MRNNFTKTSAWPVLLTCLALAANLGSVSAQTCIGEKGKIQWLLYENFTSSDDRSVTRSAKYPQAPDWIEDITNLASPTNYNNYYGALIRGFIKAPETGGYQFNLTGDDHSLFYLSTDTLKTHLALRAEVPGWSNTTEYDKYPEQTSATINLTAGQYYYFEARQKEGGGGDFIWVHWKTPSMIGGTDWDVVPDSAVYESLCEPICPKAGTACNDGNAATANDQEDGNCHCSGTPTSLPFACIGQRGSLRALYFDGITGSTVVNMYNDPDYPNNPNRAETLTTLQGPLTTGSNYGTRVRGYLRPPVTGKYIFNVTGDNEVRLRLGIGETTAITDEIAYNDGYTDPYDHFNTTHQTSDTLTLQAGQFYSIELAHKENNGGDYYYVFWKTPFPRDTAWHVIDGAFLYQYGCETACIPAGTPCNDGNANTFNDVYNASCACVGTPCSDPACTNNLGYTPLDPCEDETERHSTNPNSSWLSCNPTQSPNPERGVGHWINYDFGQIYALDDAQIWNYNGLNNAAQGFHQVVIDYSLDGVHWSELGTFNWAQASGSPAYAGFDFTAFNGISARYVLITALSNFDGSGCAGLSEVVINATTCPAAGTPCDDGNPESTNDTYNIYCYCVGILPATNECDDVALIKNEVPIASGKYDAELTIVSAGLVRTGTNISFIAGESVTLQPGFEVEFGSEFLAAIAPCTPHFSPGKSIRQAGRFFKNLFHKKTKETKGTS